MIHDCRARAEANLELVRYEFKLPPLLTDEDIEDILTKVDNLVAWAGDIKEYALQQAISGKEWSGWKLVEGRSNRKYTNEPAVIDAVEGVGFDPYERKVLGVTAMITSSTYFHAYAKIQKTSILFSHQAPKTQNIYPVLS